MINFYYIRNPYNTRLWEDILMEGTFQLIGIRSHPARKIIEKIQPGDKALFYNKNENKQVVGVLSAKTKPYSDPTDSSGKWIGITLQPQETFTNPVSLSEIKELKEFSDSKVIKQPRLTVVEITEEQFEAIIELSK